MLIVFAAAAYVRSNLAAGVAVAAMASVVFLATNRIFSPQFLVLFLTAWALAVTVELGTNRLLGADPERIPEIPELLARTSTTTEIPLWNGRAGPRAAEVPLRFLREPDLLVRACGPSDAA